MATSQRIMMVAWGSRGDIQPVVALASHLESIGRDVLVFATPPATELLESQGVPFVAAKENIEEFVEQLFGQVDLADRSLSGFLKLAKFGREYINSDDYVELQQADVARAFAAAQDFEPLSRYLSVVWASAPRYPSALRVRKPSSIVSMPAATSPRT